MHVVSLLALFPKDIPDLFQIFVALLDTFSIF